MILVLTIINSFAFIIYGVLCLTTDHMLDEFQRYQMLRFRDLTGYLEVLGGLGCVIGYFHYKPLFIFSCLGLAILMTLGVIVRLRVGDPLIQILPATFLALLNFYFLWISLFKK